MAALGMPAHLGPRSHAAVRCELYRQRCKDEDGNRRTEGSAASSGKPMAGFRHAAATGPAEVARDAR